MGFLHKISKFISSIVSEEKVYDEQVQTTKSKTEKTLAQKSESLSIDISSVLNDPQIKNILVTHAMECCKSIENVPQEFRESIGKAILDNFYDTLPEGVSLNQQIQSIYQMSKKEATLISRDQTGKLTARLNQARQENIGVTHYIWHAVDNRCNHMIRDKKKFKWSTPPVGGHPGQSYLCVCHAEAVIDIKKLTRMARK